MDNVRLGVIGLGNMGQYHVKYLREGAVSGCILTAVSDAVPARTEALASEMSVFATSEALIRSGQVDAVLIATPHFAHTTIGIDALQHGLHVLVEKPISVHVADAARLLAAHTDPNLAFAAMFNLRLDARFLQLKRIMVEGRLGQLQRVNWVMTDWFRTEAYYASSAWRATWRGEGGGLLINQAPHQLDMLQWLTGMPVRVRAFCGLGRRHAVEVEDEVTAYLEYANGATGVFIASTGENPGTNRLELVGDRGRLVLEANHLTLSQNMVSASEFSRSTSEPFGQPQCKVMELPLETGGGTHQVITQNFCDAIRLGTPLVAPAEEGIHSVELANAMLYSSLTGQTVELPLDGQAYENQLNELIASSTFRKVTTSESAPADITRSFHKR
ncbi:MAG: Gfo/Idh/MocA family protein [Anaerolineae bacterium]